MSTSTDSVTSVSLKSSPDYLPHVRRIMACIADSVGMDEQETNDAKLALTEACVNAIRHGSPQGSDGNVFITLSTSENTIIADITDTGDPSDISTSDDQNSGFGISLMRKLADKVQFIKHKTGLTVRLTKRARKTTRLVSDPDGVNRN